MADDSSSDDEKTEDPTPQRLEKAREEGQVARSRELATFLLLLAGALGLATMGDSLFNQVGGVMEQAFLFDRRQAMETAPMLAKALVLGQRTLVSLLPLFLLLAVVALVAPALLGGWVISAKSLQPQASKLNPLKGLKRIFGTQALVEMAKAIAKSVLVGSVGMAYLYLHRGDFMALMNQPIHQALVWAMNMAIEASSLMILTLLVVILIDVPYQLWSHAKQLRMTKDEVKREHKESEGDPQLKGRIRQQQQAMARGRMMSEVPEADVIVTNPTHYAVALAYEEAGMAAPKVVAKGADAVATRIRELGEEARVPLLEAAPLARSLYHHVDLEAEIPADLYTAVAEVLAWAFGLKRAAAEGAEAPPTPENLSVPAAMEAPHRDATNEARG